MSLLKWKELAQRKTELGNKINHVHNLITQHKIGQQTSQESLDKVFKPVSSKLDELIDGDENLRMPQRRKRPSRKREVPNYGIDIEDEVEDINLGDLFDEQPVSPESEKQIAPMPPTYEKSLEDIFKGKEIYVDPQYFPQYPQELPYVDPQYPQEPPPEYDEEVDYTIDDYDLVNKILDDNGMKNYEDVNYHLNQPTMTPQKSEMFLKKVVKDATSERNKLKGKKADVTKKYNMGLISEADRQVMNKQIDNTRTVLNKDIKHHNDRLGTMKGSGIKGRGRKQRGGNVMFFNDVKQLLNKLEWIIGEVLAGNTSIQMRNTGVNILDTLLRMSTINRLQYNNKLYNLYFKV